jgi:hypothetical protein
MALEPINTKARSKSRGNRFGLEGNLYLWLVAAAFLSVAVVVFTPLTWSITVRLFLGLIPMVVTGLYVVLLKHRQPPNYDRDILAAAVNGRSFDQSQFQPIHPIIGAQRRALRQQGHSANS